MSTTITNVFATACLGLAAFQSNVAFDAETRLKVTEEKVTELQKLVLGQAKDLAEAKLLAERGAKYAEAQARAAAKMLETLDASEKAGFTWGINPESRTILLAGWRDTLSAAQRDLPSLPVADPAGGRPAAQNR